MQSFKLLKRRPLLYRKHLRPAIRLFSTETAPKNPPKFDYSESVTKEYNLAFEKNTKMLEDFKGMGRGKNFWTIASYGFLLAAIIGIQYYASRYTGKLDLFGGDKYEEIKPEIDDEISQQNLNKRKKRGFAKVFGCKEAKEQLQDAVAFMKTPEKFEKMGAKMPKGILFHGPPGCGKTMLAKALAEEANVHLLITTGSSFEGKYNGSGPMNIKRLFKKARKIAPCIIFIDEIDTISTPRSTLLTSSHSTLNQFLSEMDGFEVNDKVLVIGATNLAENLDSAMTRSGRFDRKIEIHLPDLSTRRSILQDNLKKSPTNRDVDIDEIAKQTVGLNGADMTNIANTAAFIAVRQKAPEITYNILKEALTRVSLGRENTSLHLSDRVKHCTAVHEAGHAVAGLLTPAAGKVNQLTILPRGMSLGSTWYTLRENTQYVSSREDLVAMIDSAMGGYVAEEVVFGPDKASTGASSDFQNATQIALEMVSKFGMSQSLGRYCADSGDIRTWSPFLKEKVFEEVSAILGESYDRVKAKITSHRALLDSLAREVERRETLSRQDILEIWGQSEQ